MDWKTYFSKVFGFDSLKAAEDAVSAKTEGKNWAAFDAASSAVTVIETVLWIIIGIVGLAAVIYAIYLGFNLARASEQGKRDEAKKHLITVIIAIVVTLALVIFFLYLLPGILGAFYNGGDSLLEGTGTDTGKDFISMFR